MTYATVAQVIEQLGSHEVLALTDRSNVGEIDQDVLRQALARASSEIDSYIATRYPVPVAAPLPLVLVTRCIDVAHYYLCRGSVVLSEPVRDAYDDAVKWLTHVAAGKASLGLPVPVVDGVVPVVDAVLFNPATPSVFGRGVTGGDE